MCPPRKRRPSRVLSASPDDEVNSLEALAHRETNGTNGGADGPGGALERQASYVEVSPLKKGLRSVLRAKVLLLQHLFVAAVALVKVKLKVLRALFPVTTVVAKKGNAWRAVGAFIWDDRRVAAAVVLLVVAVAFPVSRYALTLQTGADPVMTAPSPSGPERALVRLGDDFGAGAVAPFTVLFDARGRAGGALDDELLDAVDE